MKRFICTALSLASIYLTGELAIAADIQPAIAEFDALHFAKAKQLFTVIAKDEQHKNAANYYLGRIAMANTNYADAKAYFEESVKSPPNQADELYWLGNADASLALQSSMLSAPGLISSYRQNTEAALAINPSHLPALLNLYQFSAATPGIMGGSSEKAAQLLSRIESISKVHADIGRLYLLNSKKEVDKAVALAQTMIASYPSSDQALFEAGKTLSNNKRYAEALVAFEKVTVAKMTTENFMRVQGAYYEIGQVSVRSKTNLDQGIAALSKVTDPEIFPVNTYTNWGYWRLAQLQQMKGDVMQYKRYLALLEKTGVQKDRRLKDEMDN